MKKAEVEYQGQLADISMRRTVLYYIESQMNPNVDKNSKYYTRRRVKENNGNIE